MNKSYVVHGPSGCGKSANAHRIKKSLGLKHVVDDWDWSIPIQRFDHLYLTNVPPPHDTFPARRIISFDDWQKEHAAVASKEGRER